MTVVTPPANATREQLLAFCREKQIKHHWRNNAHNLRRKIDAWAHMNDPSVSPLEPLGRKMAHYHLKRLKHDRPGAVRIIQRYLAMIEPLAVAELEAQNGRNESECGLSDKAA